MSDDSAHQLSSPIEMDLGDNPGKIRFDSLVEVKDWADKQSQWSTEHCRQRNNQPHFDSLFDHQESPSNELQTISNDAIAGTLDVEDAVAEIKKVLTKYQDHEAVHGEGPIGQFLTSLASDDFAVIGGLAAATGYHPHDYVGTMNAQQLGSFAGGYQLMQLAFPRLRDKEAESVRIKLNALHEEQTRRFNQERATQEAIQGEIKEATDGLRKEAEAQKSALDALQRQYGDFMKLESPAKYWSDRAKESNDRAAKLMKTFGVVAVLGIAAVLIGYPLMLLPFKGEDGSVGAWTIGLMSAPAAILLTTLALLFRTISGYVKDATAANERSTMIMTYIAFAGDDKNPMDEEHRRHVLDRMFTPTLEDNAIKDSTHPYLDAIRELRELSKKDE